MAGLLVGEYAERTGVQCLGVDTAADIGAVARLVAGSVTLQGNLDPLALEAGGEAMRSAAADILVAMRERPFVFNLGHGIVPTTPPGHVAELVGLVRGA
jgi:uroporphyrinogen decarboxylase